MNSGTLPSPYHSLAEISNSVTACAFLTKTVIGVCLMLTKFNAWLEASPAFSNELRTLESEGVMNLSISKKSV